MIAPTRLFITEKPDAARNLAAGVCAAERTTVVNQATRAKDGFIQLANGDVILPFRGHMIEPVFLQPKHKAAQKETFFDFLPIVVKEWVEYQPKPEIDRESGKPKMRDGKPVPSHQYKVACDLIKRAKIIVNAGDVDREGQLIVDEMLAHVGIDPTTPSILRLPLVSAREDDIKDQVLDLAKPGAQRNGDLKWVRRRQAAYARSLIDAGIGLNASMAYQSVSGNNRMAIGRMQTPVVALVVARDEAIDNFKPVNFYVPVVTLQDGTEMRFYRREGAENTPGFDSEGRIISLEIAQQMCNAINRGMPGNIKHAATKKSSEAPPLPFSATVLSSTVAKRTGMTPKDAEKAAQSLYEKKTISYVGTDCQFLPTSVREDARATCAAMSKLYPRVAAGVDLKLVSAAWNDAKVDEHHAIIPLGPLPQNATPEERDVFDAVARRYMAQFYPNHEFKTHQLQALFGNDEFRASRRETVVMGWKEVEGEMERGGPTGQNTDEQVDEDADQDQEKKQEVHR